MFQRAILSFVLIFLFPCMAAAKAPFLPVQIVKEYPHNPNSSTQGLTYGDGLLYESSGGFGRSFLSAVDIESGTAHWMSSVDSRYFAEGLAERGDELYMLTWLSGTGIIYDKKTLMPIREFSYRSPSSKTEGWGLTYDGQRFIKSSGTSRLTFHSPEGFAETHTVSVRDGERPVLQLNELEFVNGSIFANLWKSDKIAVINPRTGQVRAWLDLAPLRDRISSESGVANGIAYDAENDRLFVTGKCWDKLFEIRVDGLSKP